MGGVEARALENHLLLMMALKGEEGRLLAGKGGPRGWVARWRWELLGYWRRATLNIAV